MKKSVFWSLVIFFAVAVGTAVSLAIYFRNRLKCLEDELYLDEYYDEDDEFEDDEFDYDYDVSGDSDSSEDISSGIITEDDNTAK